MKLGKALLIVMSRWQITGYRLSQSSGIDRPAISRLLKGESQSASWDVTEKLANGFEKLDPIAKDAFIGALQRPDNTYPNISDNTIALFWQRESSESIAAVMAVLDECKLLDQERIKALKTKLAEKDAEADVIPPTTIEDFISSRMIRIRREQDGELTK